MHTRAAPKTLPPEVLVKEEEEEEEDICVAAVVAETKQCYSVQSPLSLAAAAAAAAADKGVNRNTLWIGRRLTDELRKLRESRMTVDSWLTTITKAEVIKAQRRKRRRIRAVNKNNVLTRKKW